MKYLLEGGDPITQTLGVPRNGRVTIDVKGGLDLDGDGTRETQIGSPFSTVVTSTNNVNIAVERAMYWNEFEGGHESTAVTAPHKTWLFAEGNTGGDAAFSWDTYLLLANPQAAEVQVTLTFFRQTGTPVVHNVTLAHQLAQDREVRKKMCRAWRARRSRRRSRRSRRSSRSARCTGPRTASSISRGTTRPA